MDALIANLRKGTQEPLFDLRQDAADRIEELESEVERLHALHFERTKLTTRVIQERDAAEAKLAAVFKAFLIYRRSEGCSCCRDTETHEAAEGALGELFGVPRYSDDSGVDWPEPTSGAT